MLNSHRIKLGISAAIVIAVLSAVVYSRSNHNPPPELWTIKLGRTASGKPSIERSNILLSPANQRYPYEAIFDIAFIEQGTDGLPGPSELDALRKIEDQLDLLINKKLAGQFANIQTMEGHRKFLF